MEEFLLNPNIAYLLIVVGFLLTIFAILAPGTGMLEIGAVFILLFVGYQIYNLPVNYWALALLGLGIVPFILTLRQKKPTLNLALSALAFVTGSAFLFRSENWWVPAVHPILAVTVSIVAGGFFWLITIKILEARLKPPSHDLSGLIGTIGETRTEVHLEGSVYVGGEMWTAQSNTPIKAGTRVKVISREGLILQVEKIDIESN